VTRPEQDVSGETTPVPASVEPMHLATKVRVEIESGTSIEEIRAALAAVPRRSRLGEVALHGDRTSPTDDEWALVDVVLTFELPAPVARSRRRTP
jgi:hypothetical protein